MVILHNNLIVKNNSSKFISVNYPYSRDSQIFSTIEKFPWGIESSSNRVIAALWLSGRNPSGSFCQWRNWDFCTRNCAFNVETFLRSNCRMDFAIWRSAARSSSKYCSFLSVITVEYWLNDENICLWVKQPLTVIPNLWWKFCTDSRKAEYVGQTWKILADPFSQLLRPFEDTIYLQYSNSSNVRLQFLHCVIEIRFGSSMEMCTRNISIFFSIFFPEE